MVSGYNRSENGGMAFAAIQSGHHSIDFSQADVKSTQGTITTNSLLIIVPPKFFTHKMNVTELVEIIILIIVWYTSSSLNNNLNKMILAEDVFPFPYTLTLYQFGSIAVFCYLMVLLSSTYKLQTVNTNFAKLVVPLCASQIVAHLLTQSSLQHVPVSFTHTIKGCSPIFAILLSRYYHFNETYSVTLFAGVFAIIGGVVMSSFNEINFNFYGFITALGSTLVFSWQNAFSKKIFRDKEMDHVNLLFYTSSFAFVMMLPMWFIYDLPHIYAFSGLQSSRLSGLLLLDGICHFGQNIAAFTFMTKVTPLTYTVFNTFKRTFVIISAILYFGNSVNFFNALGIALTTAGVALYNKAKLDMRTSK